MRATASTHAKEIQDEPGIEENSEKTVCDGNFQVGVMKEKCGLMKIVDSFGQFGLNLVRVPSQKWLFTEHVEGGLVNNKPKFDWAAVFEARRERSVRVGECATKKGDDRPGQDQEYAWTAYAYI